MEREEPKRGVTASNVATTFVNFANLPGELQFLIWKHAVDSVSGNILEIDYWGREENNEPFSSRYPALLHACHDSRVEFLRRYTINMDECILDERPHWVDTENQIILFVHSLHVPHLDERIQHVAVFVDDQDIFEPLVFSGFSYLDWLFMDETGGLVDMWHLKSYFFVRKNLQGRRPEDFNQKIAADLELYIREFKDEKFTKFVRNVKPRFITYDQLCRDWK